MSNDSFQLGRPQALPPKAEPVESETKPSEETAPKINVAAADKTVRREGSDMLDVPSAIPTEVRILSEEEIEAGKKRQDQENEQYVRRQIEMKLEELRRSEVMFRIPPWVKSLLTWATVFLAAVLLLFMVVQVANFLAVVASLSVVSRWLIGICGGFCCLVIVAVWVKIGLAVYRLGKKPTLNLEAVRLLNERIEWQHLAMADADQARQTLKKYVHDYPLDNEGRRMLVHSLGMKPETFDKLLTGRDELLNPQSMDDALSWINKFQDNFQKILDDLAEQRVAGYYYKVMTGTALSPNAMVDQLIVVSACTALVYDLLRIYQIRPAAGQSLVILSRSIVLSYIGGNLQKTMEVAVDKAGETLSGATQAAADMGIVDVTQELTKVFGTKFVDALPVVGKLTAPITAKIAEGTLNGLLIYRLGKSIIVQLHPTDRPRASK